MAQALSITVNGEPRTAPAGATVTDVLVLLAVPAGKVAVERNRAIVPASQHATTALADGDALEIVTFVGGG